MVLVGTGGLPGDSQESLHKQIIKMRGVFIPATLRTTANICINTRVPRDFGSYLPTLRLQKPRVEFPYQSLELIFFFHLYEKDEQWPLFLYKLSLYRKQFHRLFHPRDRIVFICLFYLDPTADSTAKFEVFSAAQHKKKIGLQQRQEREAESSSTDCHLCML